MHIQPSSDSASAERRRNKMSEEKVALVTAAGRGMGAGIARELHARGYRLGLMSPSGAAKKLARELSGVGLTGSVTEPGHLSDIVNRVLQAHGRIDAVVNHTGHPPKGELLEIPDEDWQRGLDLALLNVVRMCRLVTPHMQRQGGGAIVNISTFAAFEPEEIFPVSACIRAGLAGFTKIYADKYAGSGIRMNNILPGFIDSLPATEERCARIPMGRYGTVQEISKAVAFLLSDDAGYITGQNIRVDGGITRHV
jgi:NAD(P)-dependent dehydrogenase (short-subunit alcohol dehydrogenase family)